uniref:Uncharacterized protein n=1 Tax=Panagrolaimus superbus TaxID=310955 RepID=A0A914Y1Z3_9BILA
MDTPRKLPPFPSGTSTRNRRQIEVEPQPLYDEFIEILNVALSDASQAGVMMQEIAHRELHPPPATTPLRNHRKSNNQRFTPYSIERRPSNRFANPNPPPSMFDIRNTLFSPPVTPQRPALQFFSPLTLSRSADSLTPSTTPQRPSPLSNPATVSRVFNLPDFQNLHVYA